ncbi:MAG TPA: diaminopimelate decarboxylase [Terriglobia bacterium]|nr:diaminopimelate decarboxylase [Terriglobia bacterium]
MKMISSAHDFFHYRQGEFFCEDLLLATLAGRFGTPAYVYSQSAVLQNYERMRGTLARIPGLICYSVKANSHLRILSLLRREGAGFDVVSGGELARALRAGAAPDTIVFSGVGKTQDEIDAGLAAGIMMFNVESAGELAVIESRALTLQKVGRISIRVNPDVEADTHPYISTGQMIHKFGVPKDEAPELYRRAARSPNLKVQGVACHIGSQILEVEPFWKALDEILSMARQLAAEGITVEALDLGGGYGISYGSEPPLDVERLARGLEERLRQVPLRLILEPGRALVGNAGALMTRVLYVKRNQRKNFVVVDAGMNDLMRPTLYGSYHEIVPARGGAAERLLADIVGPLCESGDFFARDRDMPDVQPGDLLAVLTVGAYGFVLSSNYNTRPRPAEILVHGAEAELIRARETVDNLMAGERA